MFSLQNAGSHQLPSSDAVTGQGLSRLVFQPLLVAEQRRKEGRLQCNYNLLSSGERLQTREFDKGRRSNQALQFVRSHTQALR